MSETTVSANLLEALEILTELGVDTVGEDVGVLAIDDIALSVDEPCRDLVLGGVLEDGDDTLELFGGELTSAVTLLVYFEHIGFCVKEKSYRLFRSTSAFLQTKLEYRRPTPLILVKAYITFCFPSTLVLRRRRICLSLAHGIFDEFPRHDRFRCTRRRSGGARVVRAASAVLNSISSLW